MNAAAPSLAPTAFFLPGAGGARYCLFHPPRAQGAVRGAFVYLHPFAEEMNCARRSAGAQARALAELGFGVLQIDLTGCGDSAGEFADATWALWQQDVRDAADWLGRHCSPRVGLWGLRIGALLALDTWRSLASPPFQLLLWQPILSGTAFLTQFLRLGLARQLALNDAARYPDTGAMRAALAAGETLEIAGYELHPALALALDAVAPQPPAVAVGWLEIAAPGVPLSRARQQTLDDWRRAGVALDVERVEGAAFWATHATRDWAGLHMATACLLAADR